MPAKIDFFFYKSYCFITASLLTGFLAVSYVLLADLAGTRFFTGDLDLLAEATIGMTDDSLDCLLRLLSSVKSTERVSGAGISKVTT